MPKKTRTLKNTRQGRSRNRPVTKIREPADIIAILPYLLGFTPSESMVVVSLRGERKQFGPVMRLDLADDLADVPPMADYLVSIVQHHGFNPVMLVAFTDRIEIADRLVAELREALQEIGVAVTEALRADGRRWWSYTCHDPCCCDPAGTTYDVDSSRPAAEAVLSGLSRAPSRDALRQQFTSAPDPMRRAVGMACTELREQMLSGLDAHWNATRMASEVAVALKHPDETTLRQQTALLAAVQDIDLRDVAWTMMSRSEAEQHFLLWRGVMRVAPDHLMAPAGSLAGFAAWLAGHGVLASLAAERVQEVSPAYSMGGLLRKVLEETINPDVWDDFRDAR